MARSNSTSSAPSSAAAPSLLLERLRALVRNAPKSGATNAAERLSQLTTGKAELKEALAQCRSACAQLEAASQDAAFESAAAFASNQQAIAAAQVELKQLEAVESHVDRAIEESRDTAFDDTIREQGAALVASARENVKRVEEYERHAAAAAAALASNAQFFDDQKEFAYSISEAVRSGLRDAAWRDAMITEYHNTASQIAERLHLTNGGERLIDVVQLPSSKRLTPHFGDVHGRAPSVEREVIVEEPERPFGVYGADGKKVNAANVAAGY